MQRQKLKKISVGNLKFMALTLHGGLSVNIDLFFLVGVIFKTAWYLVCICTVLSKWEIYRWDVARVTAKCVNETQNNINYRANIIFQLHIFFLKLLSSKKNKKNNQLLYSTVEKPTEVYRFSTKFVCLFELVHRIVYTVQCSRYSTNQIQFRFFRHVDSVWSFRYKCLQRKYLHRNMIWQTDVNTLFENFTEL